MKTNRRGFIQTLGAGTAGLGLASPIAFSSCKGSADKEDNQLLYIGDDIAIAETNYGKVRGYILRDVYYFLGIPYGANTSGANRFMPPLKPEPWSDIYPAIWWGNTAPQEMENRYANKYGAFRDHWNYDDVSEDCLRINVFTPGYNDGKKRPVLVWMHGGGWTNGNAIEHDGYIGENFARFGDVVFCSMNSRLGPLGFSDLSAVGGEKYAASGNVGALDLVASLEWVRDNIANFGGDPDNITIMGQSGGGAKVGTVTAMPSAAGLVDKAVILSGATPILMDKGLTSQVGAYILKEAGLNATQIDRLQQMPWQEYYELAMRAGSKLLADTGSHLEGARRVFQPNADGTIIPQHPYYPEAPDTAKNIPMIICSATNESSPTWQDSSLESISFDGVKKELAEGGTFNDLTAEKAGEIVDAYARAFPDKNPAEIWSMITTHRQRTVILADAKVKQEAPVYTAWFGWQPPLFDNRLRAFHCLDICFWFYNTDLMFSHTGGGERPRALSEKMAGSLLQFMKTGDPNGGGLPEWPRYTSGQGELMFLDDVCEVRYAPDREAIKTLPPYEGY
ncbi:MAG: carboxylesterase/lipase family protein [Bacteroidales bacterium]|nr:carboxylesterase/lipase family protein [Bacteroidales bacterium]